jgi:hypothetical protein
VRPRTDPARHDELDGLEVQVVARVAEARQRSWQRWLDDRPPFLDRLDHSALDLVTDAVDRNLAEVRDALRDELPDQLPAVVEAPDRVLRFGRLQRPAEGLERTIKWGCCNAARW